MEEVVEEAVRFIPHLIVVIPNAIHRVRYPHKMLQEAVSYFLISGVVFCQNEGDLEHVLTVECHPRRAIRLIKMSAGRQLCTAVENSDVVEPKKAARKDVSTLRIFTVYPPIEVQHKPLE